MKYYRIELEIKEIRLRLTLAIIYNILNGIYE